MFVRDIMSTDVELVNPDMTLSEAAIRMKERDIGFLPVGENDRLVGMVTDRDIAIRGVAEGKDPVTESIRNIMTPDVQYCFENQEVGEAAKLMEDKQIRRLVVLNDDKRLVGVCSLGDFAVETSDKELGGEVLQEVSKPSKK
ncbi:MAG: CBS domain-containing protein [candidate division Zixibacteria bacterium]|nr:CBS domain-containing protein [candidate division Zixibacteria bacterium]